MSQENNQKPDCPLCEVPKESIAILKNSKKTEYDRKKQEKEKGNARKGGLKKFQKTAIFVLAAALFVGGFSVFAAKQILNGGQRVSEGTPAMEINPKEYDIGTISMAAGVVKYTYEIQNKGDGELKISSIKTSCHCTVAKLKVGDSESPSFGMDSVFSSWSAKIPSGGKGYLEVTFDPAYHGSSGVGAAVRAVYFSTNDPNHKKSEVRLSANVVQ